MESAQLDTAAKAGIGGWLLLPAAALIIQPVYALKYMVLDPARMRARGFGVHYLWPAVAVNLFIVLLALAVAYFFFQKCAVAPPLYILYALAVFAVSMVVEAFSGARGVPIVADLFGVLFYPAYFALSARVKATFVRPLPGAFPGRRIIRAAEPALLGFQAWLAKRRRRVLVYSLVVIALVFTLQCMIRAWRIDGNILNFPAYF